MKRIKVEAEVVGVLAIGVAGLVVGYLIGGWGFVLILLAIAAGAGAVAT